MSTETVVAYAALVFAILCLPSVRMLNFARWQFQSHLGARLAAGFGVFIAWACAFGAALAVVFFFLKAMPDGVVLARIVAVAFLAITAFKQMMRIKGPFPIADNSNLPARKLIPIIRQVIQTGLRPSAEIATPAAILILFSTPSALTSHDQITLTAAYGAAALASLILYATCARRVFVRLNRNTSTARKDRVEKLLRSGLPRVSARYRQDAA